MKHVAPETLALALLPHGTPMLGAVIDRIAADTGLTETRRRDMISGLRRVARALGQDPANVPADPKWLQPRLEAISPAAFGVSRKTWHTLVSDARAALAQCGIVSRRTNRQHDLGPAWRDLWGQARTCAKVHGSLSRFVYFLDRLGVAPAEVDDGSVTAFHDALMADEIRKTPQASLRNAVNAWNRAVEHVPGWPQTRLAGLPPQAERIKLPLDTYPASFAADLARFKAEAGRADFLSDSARRVLAPESIEKYARVLERFAGGAVRAGVAPERLTDLAALLSPEVVETGLHWFYERCDQVVTPGLKELILVLQQVGRRHLGREDQPHLDRLAKRLPKKRQGLTEKNRARLRPMLTPEMTARIVALPERLMARAGAETSHPACLLREQAVALALLLYCPIRRANLVSIDVTRHIQRPGDRKTYLIFPRDEVKNRVDLEFDLPAHVVAMIDRHLALRSPRLCPAGTPFLFPRRDGSRPMQAEHLADTLKTCLKRELGLDVNLHLFRHFAAHLLLENMPGNYEAARRLLGHSRLSSTLNAYTGIESTDVSRLYGEIIGARRK